MGIAGDESDALEKDNLISVQASDVVQEAKTDDKDAKETENAENILKETRLLTNADKPDSSIGVMNTYPAVLFRDQIDGNITTASLFHYLDESGYTTRHSYEVERRSEKTRASSAVEKNPNHLVAREKPSGKESSGSFRVDEPPKRLSKGQVNYPFRAKRLGLTGKVSVSFLVDTDGQATNIEAVKAEPENVLVTFAEAAEKAIAKSRFRPGTSAGEPVPVKAMAQIIFEI
jgi:TonB family protein